MKTILKTATCEEQRQELDEIRDVVTTLRNFCQNVKKAKHAVALVAEKTGLSKSRVKEIIIKINQ